MSERENLSRIWTRKEKETRLEKTRRTVKVAGVVLGLQLRDELGFLPQESRPVKAQEEGVLLDLRSSACNGFHSQSG